MIKKLLTIFLIVVMCFCSSVSVSAYNEQYDYDDYDSFSYDEMEEPEYAEENRDTDDTYTTGVDSENSKSPVKTIIICIAVGMAMGFIINFAIASKNKSVRMQRNATIYTRDGSFMLTGQYDNFLYKNLQKTPKPKNDSNNKR